MKAGQRSDDALFLVPCRAAATRRSEHDALVPPTGRVADRGGHILATSRALRNSFAGRVPPRSPTLSVARLSRVGRSGVRFQLDLRRRCRPQTAPPDSGEVGLRKVGRSGVRFQLGSRRTFRPQPAPLLRSPTLQSRAEWDTASSWLASHVPTATSSARLWRVGLRRVGLRL